MPRDEISLELKPSILRLILDALDDIELNPLEAEYISRRYRNEASLSASTVNRIFSEVLHRDQEHRRLTKPR